MSIENQIEEYISGQTIQKREDLLNLHKIILEIIPSCKLWFFDGRNSDGKVIANPNIGYGSQNLKYADGSSREFYQLGISANTTGISIYIIGIEDKNYLVKTYGDIIGKATVTGYCIKFKTLNNINLDVLREILKFGLNNSN
ncbi:DUF1801 domain-containing protein [Chryseobacterium luquanense]|uniref:DUF1801 domain-containing protein n=1 Tax=Chryseobacterium luquanense TaxID=2983766 RepID=A0ABT3Y7Q9_9FLAO|nr:DUF1801 domain-containing protein [Chryseobacterium luquanense]MCX8534200.1 DUF1801 domain-containing protein [Chryseobacterium luquanense]